MRKKLVVKWGVCCRKKHGLGRPEIWRVKTSDFSPHTDGDCVKCAVSRGALQGPGVCPVPRLETFTLQRRSPACVPLGELQLVAPVVLTGALPASQRFLDSFTGLLEHLS